MSTQMHANEVSTDVALVRQLIRAQFPQWADLPIAPVPSAGTDNALYRLGPKRVVRLPRIATAVAQVEKEQRWLPVLAPHLPLAIPTPLAQGTPTEAYPWGWSIYRWMDGENATLDRLTNRPQAAIDLAQFIIALQQIDTTGGPLSGTHNFNRGVSLGRLDANVRKAIATLHGKIDTVAATAAWEAAVETPVWDRPPVWLHGDLQSGNLLAMEGRLNAVIDFGCLGVGDPACDLLVAWNLFSVEMRAVFRQALGVDDATWARGRGWALYFGLGAFSYYEVTNPVLAGIARHAIDHALDDFNSQT